MRDDLVSEEVKIDPLVGRAAFAAAEQASIETARFGEVAHGKRKVEAGSVHGGEFLQPERERSKARG